MSSLVATEHEWLHTTCHCSYHKDPIIILASEALSFCTIPHRDAFATLCSSGSPHSHLVKYLGSHHFLWVWTCFPPHSSALDIIPQRCLSIPLVILSYLFPCLLLNSRVSCRHGCAPSVVVSSGAQIRIGDGSCENLWVKLLCVHTTILNNLYQLFSFLPWCKSHYLHVPPEHPPVLP